MTQEALIAALVDRHPAAAARVAIGFPLDEVARYLDEVDPELGARLLQAMSVWRAAGVVQRLETERAIQLVGRCDVSAAAHILRHVATDRRVRLLVGLREAMPELEQLLRFPAASVGAASRTAALALPGDQTAADALQAARALTRDLAMIYVIERPARLIGGVTLGSALQAEPQARLEWLAQPLPSLNASTPLSAVRPSPAWNERSELPVVDEAQNLVGVLRLAEVRSSDARGDLAGLASSLAELYVRGMIEAVDDVVATAIQVRP